MIYYDFINDRGYNFNTYQDALDCAQEIVNVRYYDKEIDLYAEIDFQIGKFDDDVSEDNPIETFEVALSPEDDGDVRDNGVWCKGGVI